MMDGKAGIVTGASKGMGRHFVAGLVAQGARVACLARPSDELRGLTAEFGARVAAIACDVSDPAAVNGAVAEAAAHFGSIDFLVNNAALYEPFLLEKARDDQVTGHFGVNMLGAIWCIRACIPHLRRARGHIVSISSESVRMPYPYLSVYAATKGGLEVLSAALREELRPDGIRVTLLRSGSVAGSTGSAGWDPVVAGEFFATITKSGHAAFSGDPAQPESMTQALIATLNLPSDVNVDLIEVRAAGVVREESFAR